MEAYCVKCKTKRQMVAEEATFTRSGTPATRGTCPVCGTTLYRMGRTPAHEGLNPPEVSSEARKRARTDAKRKGKLVIVESPAKAKTVGQILGRDYRVKASVGHVRDLLKSQLSVDVDHDFAPRYRVPNEKRAVVKELKKEAGRAEEIYLATDPDREGEAIAWHLLEAAEIEPERVRRVVFHEITQPAIEEAFRHHRSIDMHLVDSQQARRILDRLVGYNLSPLLWSKVQSRLSAGRVQSVALRLIVDRENAIRAFVPEEYWSVDGEFLAPDKPPAFRALLVGVDGEKPQLSDQGAVAALEPSLRRALYSVSMVKRGTRRRNPSPPFTTSTLQQEASRRLGFTARKTMSTAQQLYEGVDDESQDSGGLITYMRTDSTQVSTQAQAEARDFIASRYGSAYLPESAPVYATRSRNAQEAHEAIRPTSIRRTPEVVRHILNDSQFKLYQLIWNRFVASQMQPAEYDTLRMEVTGEAGDRTFLFRVTASSLRFSGFLEVYGEQAPIENGENGEQSGEAVLEQLPPLDVGDRLDLLELYPEQHFTQPPARFSEASLVKALEENGIGRPSTYAPTLTTLQQRGYVQREKRRLIPTEIGEIVNQLLVEHFPEIVDLGFTARMEEELDEIADGRRGWPEVIRDFYGPFAEQLERAIAEMPEVRTEPEPLDRACPVCGHTLVVRVGRFGKFIGCSTFPECHHTEPWLEKIGVKCPVDGGELVQRRTRRGRVFYGCANYPECDYTSWKRPLPEPCPNCGGLLTADGRDRAVCSQCGNPYDLEALRTGETGTA